MAVGDVLASGGTKQRLIDDAAGQRTDLGADGGAGNGGAEDFDAGWQQRAAGRGANGTKGKSGHGEGLSGGGSW